ncbi:MAG: HAMP domain-containing protein, partial [Thermodesulfovibrionales bacterium]|nr:HAMP domain-containing protein [Thermodesulfovibrionales bacterium]
MQRKILLLVIVSILVMLVSIGLVSYLTVHASIDHSLEDRLTLAKLLGRSLDYTLERNIIRLHDISFSGNVDLSDGDWAPERRALRTAYEYSMFSDGLFLMDLDGNILLSYPHKDDGAINLLGITYVQEALMEQKTVVSDVYTLSHTRRQVIFVLAPLKDPAGYVVGLVGGEIDPANYFFTWAIKAFPTGKDMKVELIDSHGIIIASNDPHRTFTYADHDRFLGNLIKEKRARVSKCHRCHAGGVEGREADMMAFAPLSFAPWGVTVRQPESVVFGPSTELQKAFARVSLIVIAVAVILSIGLSRSIISPLRALGRASERIASGDLSAPVPVYGGDEVEELAESFEAMRVRLEDSLEYIRLHTVELEDTVRERTAELIEQKKRLSLLLDEGIRAQEAERKR